MLRNAPRIAFGSILLFVTFYAADWAVWRVRLSYGTGTDDVVVSRVSIASLKGNKQEYYSDGIVTMTCSRSLFPRTIADSGVPPCWWLRRHTQVVEQY